MAKTSKDYWKDREAEAAKHYISKDKDVIKELDRRYDMLYKSIQEQINGFYNKYATDNNITMADAKKAVAKMDIKAAEARVAAMVKAKDFSPAANEFLKLYNATMRINRLEFLKANIGYDLIEHHSKIETIMAVGLTERAYEEIERQAGILGDIKYSAKQVESLVNASYQHATWSTRIWANQTALKNSLDTVLTNGLIQGKNPRAFMKDIQKPFGVATYQADRILRTEMCRVQTEAQKFSYKEADVEQYIYMAEDNLNTCEDCMALDGKIFDIKDMTPGENAPPIHPHCNCSTAPYIERAKVEKEIEEYKNKK